MKVHLLRTELDLKALLAISAAGTMYAFLVLTSRISHGCGGHKGCQCSHLHIGWWLFTIHCLIRIQSVQGRACGEETAFRRRLLYGLFYLAVLMGAFYISRILPLLV